MEKNLFSIKALSLSISLSWLLLLVVTSFPGRAATQSLTDAVFDITGQPLKSGGPYDVRTFIGNYPIIAIYTSNNRCRNLVAVDTVRRSAYSVNIQPANGQEPFIRRDNTVKFEFNNDPPCINSSVWQLAPPDPKNNGRQLVTLGGKKGKAGCDTARTWFKITKPPRYQDQNVYSIVSDSSDVCDIPVQPYYIAATGADVNGARVFAAVVGSPTALVFVPDN
ncbi:uncharacterized protein LOC127255131 [Andrographis paniculata]|uniref:uncharacterized protein LOC127255131 n=1 Tax=Andrographis paniculata TaxID=175694 RepID=UPI0021E97A63|nr:uncharacterized protein LOC127255131 [Andrographis paniculata]